MNLEEMTIEQLEDLVENSSNIRHELHLRKKEVQTQAKNALLASAKGVKLVEKYNKVKTRLAAESGKKEKVVNLTVKFTMGTKLNISDSHNWRWSGIDGVFSRELDAKIESTDANRVQKALLQEGLDNLIESACDEKFKLFSDEDKEVRKLLKDFDAVVEELEDFGISLSDLEKS